MILNFQSQILILNVTLNTSLNNKIESNSQKAISNTVDIVMNIPLGSTGYQSGVVTRRNLGSVKEPLYSVVTATSLSLLNFPQYNGDAQSLYNDLTIALLDSLQNGQFIRILRSQIYKLKAVAIASSSVGSIQLGTMSFQYPRTRTPSFPPVTIVSMNQLNNIQMTGICVGVVLGLFMTGAFVYFTARYKTKMKEKYLKTSPKTKKSTSMESQNLEETYPEREEALFYTIKDVDFDRLEYVGDTAKI